jgi:hypothetical protein
MRARTMLRRLGRIAPIKIPRTLEDYWTWSSGRRSYLSYSLRRVERERFIALCARYGWEEGISELKNRMVPLDEWAPDDRAEIKSLLDLADFRNEMGKLTGRFL